MDLFKSQFDRVRQQLAGLTPSQKMLSFSLVAIMAMTLAWFGKYAGSPEMVPLLTQAMSPEELGRAEAQLKAAGIQTKSSTDGRLLVPADAQMSAMAAMTMGGSLPKNVSSGFDDMIKQLTAWDGQDRQSAVFNHGKELTLQRIIGAMPGVDSATVVIATEYKRQLSRPDVEPKASVHVTMRDGSKGSKQLADACASLVAGAESALTTGRVTVLIGGKHWPTKESDHEDGLGGSTIIELQAAAEDKLTRKLTEHLGYVEGLRVSITMKVNGTSQTSDETIYKKETSLITEQETTSKSSEQTAAAPAANEPGVLANVQGPVAVGGSAGGGQSTSENSDTLKNFIAPGVQKVSLRTQAGEATPVGASVRVPRSYFAAILKGNDPAAKDPDPAAVDRLIANEIGSIRKAIIACTQIKAADMVTVEPYLDLQPLPKTPEVATASVVSLAVGGHAKEIALGGLALVSLFMMSMIVRKGAPAVAAPAGGNAAAAAALAAAAAAAAKYDSGEPLAGEVAGGTLSLDGVELDDDALKAQQMLGQVTAMVGDNPDAAATLIKRWMNQR